MEPLEYLHLQMGLEGIGLTQGTLMTRLQSGDDEFPLALVAQMANGHTVAYFAETLSPEIRERLAADTRKMTFPNVEVLLKVLCAYGVQPQTGHHKTYVFPPSYATVEVALVQCFAKDDPAIKAFGFDGLADQVYAIAEEGVVLSACVSARQNAHCAEAWVFTAPEHRRKGLAQRVVAAWAKSILAEGRVPFYSHTIENLASASLASKLGLIPVFGEVGIEKQV